MRLSRRSYNHRLEVATPKGYRVSQLARLNHDLDSLYELIYDDWQTITEEDYRAFGMQFVIMLQTLKQLYEECLEQPKQAGLQDEARRLGMNYSALYELNSDIVNFCIKLPQNQHMKSVLQRLAEIDEKMRHRH